MCCCCKNRRPVAIIMSGLSSVIIGIGLAVSILVCIFRLVPNVFNVVTVEAVEKDYIN